MNSYRSKLNDFANDTSGASILFALLFFLIAAVLGAIVLASVSTISGQLENLQREQQAQYSASSTAETLRDMLEGATCFVAAGNPEEATVALSPDASAMLASKGIAAQGSSADVSRSLPNTIAILVANVAKSGSLNEYRAQFNAAVEGPHAAVFGTTEIDITVDTSYDLHVSCKAGDTVVLCDLKAATEVSGGNGYPTKIKWMGATISRPTAAVSGGGA